MIILVVPKQDEGTYYHRLLVPFKNIPDVKMVQILSTEQAEEIDSDVATDITQIWFKGNLANNLDNNSIFKLARKSGVKVVMDMDDYWIPPATARYTKELWKAGIPQMLIDQMRKADHITCTHSLLADSIHKMGIPFAKITILPNQIDPTEEQYDRKWDYINEKIFWQGSVSHKFDLKMTKEAVKGKDFTIAGFQHIPEWEDIHKLMGEPNVIYSAPVSEYMAAYHKMGITLVPLQNNVFNRHKSNLKLLEAGFAKKAVVVSGVHPYLPLAKDKVNCLVATDWKTEINYLLDNPNFADDIRFKLHEEIRENHLVNTKTRCDLISYLQQ